MVYDVVSGDRIFIESRKIHEVGSRNSVVYIDAYKRHDYQKEDGHIKALVPWSHAMHKSHVEDCIYRQFMFQKKLIIAIIGRTGPDDYSRRKTGGRSKDQADIETDIEQLLILAQDHEDARYQAPLAHLKRKLDQQGVLSCFITDIQKAPEV